MAQRGRRDNEHLRGRISIEQIDKARGFGGIAGDFEVPTRD